MPHSWTASIVAFAVVGALVGGSTSIGVTAGAVQRVTRVVYVSATDKDGSPITDLQAADFELKLGGKRLDVVSAGPAQAPLRIALIVSDAGTGAFQLSLAKFMQKLLGQAEFALISVIVQPEKVVDYSAESAVLRAGLVRLGARGPQPGAQLMEAIQNATQDVRRDGRRPAIVVVRVGAEASSPISGNDVREQLRKSGAILYVVSTLSAQRPSPSQARQGISTEQAQLHDDEMADSTLNLGQVLGDGSKESGGRHDHVISTTLVPALERVADELLHQYALACALPDGAKPSDKLSVSSKRKGVTVRAPSRLPD
jgi:hypothetical protein